MFQEIMIPTKCVEFANRPTKGWHREDDGPEKIVPWCGENAPTPFIFNVWSRGWMDPRLVSTPHKYFLAALVWFFWIGGHFF